MDARLLEGLLAGYDSAQGREWRAEDRAWRAQDLEWRQKEEAKMAAELDFMCAGREGRSRGVDRV
jgi:hypothetical protein